MAWGSKPEEKPVETKPEEKPTLSTDELLAKMGELLNPLATSLNETKQRLQAIEEAGKKPETPREPSSVLDDETKWKEENLTPLAIATINTNARITENEVLSELRSQGLDEFIPEIKKILGETPVGTKAGNFEQYCRNVVDMVLGREARKGGLKRSNSRFILEDASASSNNSPESKLAQEDKDFLNFEVVTSKGKHVRRGEFLERMGIDIHDPDTLKKVKADWSKVQVVN